MKIGWNPESIGRLGGTRGIQRSRLFDANGLEWKGGITWCDTETGEIERIVLENGMKVVRDGELAREMIRTAAPLLIVHPKEKPGHLDRCDAETDMHNGAYQFGCWVIGELEKGMK